MLKVIENKREVEDRDTAEVPTLDALAREGARRMLETALHAEVRSYLETHQERDKTGRALVTRNGFGQERTVLCGAGTLPVKAPRVRDARVDEQGERSKFTSRILPPYMRKSPKLSEVLPILYLRGLSTGDFEPALRELLGADAAGLSAPTITRLTGEWQTHYAVFSKRDLSDTDYVYVWVDGIHFNIRLEEDRLCVLVMIGVKTDGTKELISIMDGYRESTESWSSLLRDLKRRGMKAPKLAIGDGALGFWAAKKDVWPETREQRCWVHKIANVLDKFPKRLQPKAKSMLHDIMYADTQHNAEKSMDDFIKEFSAKYPKATQCLDKDRHALLTLFDFPAEHWKHIRTTNVIESPFATVRLRQRVTKGAGSRNKGLLMAFKLLDMAQLRWRKLDAPQLLSRVHQGEIFTDGLPHKSKETKHSSNSEAA